MPFRKRMGLPAGWLALLLGAAPLAPLAADNGDLLSTSTALQGKEISCICADPTNGTFWALGETSGKIYHLDASLQKVGEIPNPHGIGVFPNIIFSRGIAFRPATGNLLVLARKSITYPVKEVTRAGIEVPAGGFAVDASSLKAPNLFGLAHDPAANQFWIVDDDSDQVLRVSATGSIIAHVPFPGAGPPGSSLKGSGISLRQEGPATVLSIAWGDLFTLAPSRILDLTVIGAPTGIEVPLKAVPAPSDQQPVRKIGGILVGTFGGKDEAIVIGEKGLLHVLDRVKPNPIPPTFFTARLTGENGVLLSWTNHGGTLNTYTNGIKLLRDGKLLVVIGGAKSQYLDTTPPAEGLVTYTVQGSNDGKTFSPPATAQVVVGKGGLMHWVPFPGDRPFDIARDTTSGDVFVTDSSGGMIYRLDRNLVTIDTVPSPYPHPGGIAFNPAGNKGAGSLMVVSADAALMREIDLDGKSLDLQTPIDFSPIANPQVGGLVYNPTTSLYTCVEASTRQLISFDRNGNQRASCVPPDLFTQKLDVGLGFDRFTGNFHALFDGGFVRELFSSCAPTSFNFDLSSLGEASTEPDFVQGMEVVDNTLIVCAGPAGTPVNALFQVLIFPQGKTFIRGDVDGDGKVQLTDAVMAAEYLFKAGPSPSCLDAADANDDGELDVSDPVYLLFFLFMGGPAPPAPFPNPGADPTFLDGIQC